MKQVNSIKHKRQMEIKKITNSVVSKIVNIKWRTITPSLVLFVIVVIIICTEVRGDEFIFGNDKKVVGTQSNLPKYNPNTENCEGMPEPLIKPESFPNFNPNNYSWQFSAPRGIPGKTYMGEVISLGLRNKYGENKDNFYFSVRVEQPNGNASTTENVLSTDNWAYSDYPTDSNSGDTNQTGPYTVIYQIYGVIVACDGFEVF